MTYKTRILSKRGLRSPPCYFTVRLALPLLAPPSTFFHALASSLSETELPSLVLLPGVHESLGKLLSSSCKRLPDRPSLHLLSSSHRLYLSSLVSLYSSLSLRPFSSRGHAHLYFSLSPSNFGLTLMPVHITRRRDVLPTRNLFQIDILRLSRPETLRLKITHG